MGFPPDLVSQPLATTERGKLEVSQTPTLVPERTQEKGMRKEQRSKATVRAPHRGDTPSAGRRAGASAAIRPIPAPAGVGKLLAAPGGWEWVGMQVKKNQTRAIKAKALGASQGKWKVISRCMLERYKLAAPGRASILL